MKMKKYNKILIATLVLAISIGSSFAYFYQRQDVENFFSTLKPEMQIFEKFNQLDKWMPGEEKQKEVSFRNAGEIVTLLRFQINIGDNGTGVKADDLILWAGEGFLDLWDPVDILQENGRVILKPDTWYYYKKVMQPNDQTPITLKSVSFNKNLNNDSGHDTDVSGKTVDVDVKAEMIQIDNNAAETLFGRSYSINSDGIVNWR